MLIQMLLLLLLQVGPPLDGQRMIMLKPLPLLDPWEVGLPIIKAAEANRRDSNVARRSLLMI